jgi:hypothetical protein
VFLHHVFSCLLFNTTAISYSSHGDEDVAHEAQSTDDEIKAEDLVIKAEAVADEAPADVTMADVDDEDDEETNQRTSDDTAMAMDHHHAN